MLFRSDVDLRDKYDDLIGDGLSGLPIINNTHYKAFKSYYAALAVRDGIDNDSVKSGIAEEAFKAVVGDTLKLNGKHIVLPEGVGEDSFLNRIRNISPMVVEQMGGVHGYSNDEAAELLREDAQYFVTSRPNVYRVALDGKLLISKDRKNFIEFYFSADAGTGNLLPVFDAVTGAN